MGGRDAFWLGQAAISLVAAAAFGFVLVRAWRWLRDERDDQDGSARHADHGLVVAGGLVVLALASAGMSLAVRSEYEPAEVLAKIMVTGSLLTLAVFLVAEGSWRHDE